VIEKMIESDSHSKVIHWSADGAEVAQRLQHKRKNEISIEEPDDLFVHEADYEFGCPETNGLGHRRCKHPTSGLPAICMPESRVTRVKRRRVSATELTSDLHDSAIDDNLGKGMLTDTMTGMEKELFGDRAVGTTLHNLSSSFGSAQQNRAQPEQTQSVESPSRSLASGSYAMSIGMGSFASTPTRAQPPSTDDMPGSQVRTKAKPEPGAKSVGRPKPKTTSPKEKAAAPKAKAKGGGGRGRPKEDRVMKAIISMKAFTSAPEGAGYWIQFKTGTLLLASIKKDIDAEIGEIEEELLKAIDDAGSVTEVEAAVPALMRERKIVLVKLSKQLHVCKRILDAYSHHGGYTKEFIETIDEGADFLNMEPVAELLVPSFMMLQRHEVHASRLTGDFFWAELDDAVLHGLGLMASDVDDFRIEMVAGRLDEMTQKALDLKMSRAAIVDLFSAKKAKVSACGSVAALVVQVANPTWDDAVGDLECTRRACDDFTNKILHTFTKHATGRSLLKSLDDFIVQRVASNSVEVKLESLKQSFKNESEKATACEPVSIDWAVLAVALKAMITVFQGLPLSSAKRYIEVFDVPCITAMLRLALGAKFAPPSPCNQIFFDVLRELDKDPFGGKEMINIPLSLIGSEVAKLLDFFAKASTLGAIEIETISREDRAKALSNVRKLEKAPLRLDVALTGEDFGKGVAEYIDKLVKQDSCAQVATLVNLTFDPPIKKLLNFLKKCLGEPQKIAGPGKKNAPYVGWPAQPIEPAQKFDLSADDFNKLVLQLGFIGDSQAHDQFKLLGSCAFLCQKVSIASGQIKSGDSSLAIEDVKIVAEIEKDLCTLAQQASTYDEQLFDGAADSPLYKCVSHRISTMDGLVSMAAFVASLLNGVRLFVGGYISKWKQSAETLKVAIVANTIELNLDTLIYEEGAADREKLFAAGDHYKELGSNNQALHSFFLGFQTLNGQGTGKVIEYESMKLIQSAMEAGTQCICSTWVCFVLFRKVLQAKDIEVRKTLVDQLIKDLNPKGFNIPTIWADGLEAIQSGTILKFPLVDA
jgi:hypothetical protein